MLGLWVALVGGRPEPAPPVDVSALAGRPELIEAAHVTKAEKGSADLEVQIKRVAQVESSDVVLSRPARRPKGKGQHGVHARAGIVLVPSFVLNAFLRSYSNSVCRAQVGSVAQSQGTNRVGGCNFHVAGGYRWSRRRLAMHATVDYTRLRMPTSNWLGKGEEVNAADLTEVDLHLTSGMFEILGEYPIVRRRRDRGVGLSWRIGGGIGLAVVGGGVFRTKLGSQTEDCEIDSLGELDKCRPYRPLEFNEPGRESAYFADCDTDECSEADLIRAGRVRESAVPGALPVVQIVTGPRLSLGRWVNLSGEAGVGLGLRFSLALDASF